MRNSKTDKISTVVRRTRRGFVTLLFATIAGCVFVTSLATPYAVGQHAETRLVQTTPKNNTTDDEYRESRGKELNQTSVFSSSGVSHVSSLRAIQPDLQTTVMIVAAEKFPNVLRPNNASPNLESSNKDANLARRFLGTEDTFAYELSPTSERATLENFNRVVKQIASETPSESRFVLYITTHGEWDSKGEFFLLTEDSKIKYDGDQKVESVSNAISGKELASAIASIKSKEVVLIVDACYASGVFQASYFSSLFQEETKKRSFYGIFSANNEPSQVRMDNGISVFTYYFDLAVVLGDVNLDGVVSMDEIYNFLKTRVKSFSLAQSEEALRRKSEKTQEFATKSSSIQNTFDVSSFQDALDDAPLFHEPTRVFAQFEGSVPAFKAPKLNVKEAFDYLAQGIAETLKLNKIHGRRVYVNGRGAYVDVPVASVEEFSEQLSEDQSALTKNPVGLNFAVEIEKRVSHFLDTTERPIIKSLSIRPKVSPRNVVTNEKESEVKITGAFYDRPQQDEIIVRCDIETKEGFLDPLTVHVDRKQVDLYLIEPQDGADAAPIEPETMDEKGGSAENVSSPSETFNGYAAKDENSITLLDPQITQPNDSFQNPQTSPLKIQIEKKVGRSTYRAVYSSNKTEGKFPVEKDGVLRISATNETDKIYAAIVLVDGLNIVANSSDNDSARVATPDEHLRKGNYWICKPKYEWHWNGWQKRSAESQNGKFSVIGREFKVVNPPESLARRVDPSQNLGDIRILIYEVKEVDSRTRDPFGIGEGAEVKSTYVESKLRADSNKPVAVVVLKYYDKNEK